jgi:hypothetical protein
MDSTSSSDNNTGVNNRKNIENVVLEKVSPSAKWSVSEIEKFLTIFSQPKYDILVNPKHKECTNKSKRFNTWDELCVEVNENGKADNCTCFM